MTTPEDDPGDAGRADIDRIFAAHYDRVRRSVLRLVHDPAEAQDLTQEIFVKAYRALPQFRGEASFATWLTRIAENVVLDHYRQTARRRDTVRVGEGPLDVEALPETGPLTLAQAAEQEESGACVQRCVDALDDKYRQAVALHDMAGLTNREVARLLGVSLETVKIRVHRGRHTLKAIFDRHCEVYANDRNELACQPKAGGMADPDEPVGPSRSGRTRR